MKKNHKGFSIVEVFVVIVVVSLLGLLTGMVYIKHQSQETPVTPTAAVTETKKTAPKLVAKKTYSNSQYGFMFTYPDDWNLDASAVKDIGRGEPQGNITLTSKTGTVINFNANLGGKGGTCGEGSENVATTRYCTTFTIQKLTPFDSGIDGRAFYAYQAKITSSDNAGGESYYQIGIKDNQYDTPVVGTKLTAFSMDIISTAKDTSPNAHNLNIYITTKDTSANATSDYFELPDIKTAATVLSTLRLAKE